MSERYKQRHSLQQPKTETTADQLEGFDPRFAFGLDRVFKGWARLGLADHEILSRGLPGFDGLYAFLKSTP